MTLDEKKNLALEQDINILMQNLGHEPVKQTGSDVWYVSPFNPNEKTASFHVSKGRQIKTIWYDFSTGKSGNIINFVRELENLRFGEAIDFILSKTNQLGVEGRLNFTPTPPPPLKAEEKEDRDRYELQQVKEIFSPAIFGYLEKERGVDRAIIKTHMKQVHFLDTDRNKSYYAGGIKNIKGGYEVNHKLGKKFKSAIPSSSKSISFIEGSIGEKKKIQVFSGFIDSLSHITYQNMNQLQKTRYFDIDTLILNSDRLSSQAIQFIKKGNYEQVIGYFDHDKSGFDVMSEFQQELGYKFKDASGVYQGHNDYNDFLLFLKKDMSNSRFK